MPGVEPAAPYRRAGTSRDADKQNSRPAYDEAASSATHSGAKRTFRTERRREVQTRFVQRFDVVGEAESRLPTQTARTPVLHNFYQRRLTFLLRPVHRKLGKVQQAQYRPQVSYRTGSPQPSAEGRTSSWTYFQPAHAIAAATRASSAQRARVRDRGTCSAGCRARRSNNNAVRARGLGIRLGPRSID